MKASWVLRCQMSDPLHNTVPQFSIWALPISSRSAQILVFASPEITFYFFLMFSLLIIQPPTKILQPTNITMRLILNTTPNQWHSINACMCSWYKLIQSSFSFPLLFRSYIFKYKSTWIPYRHSLVNILQTEFISFLLPNPTIVTICIPWFNGANI